jgi:hypothetical protein
MDLLFVFAFAAVSGILGGVVVTVCGWSMGRPQPAPGQGSRGFGDDDDPLRPGGTSRL